MKKILPYIAVITAMLIWSGSGIAVKSALVVLEPMEIVVCRFTLAVVLMLFVGLLTNTMGRASSSLHPDGDTSHVGILSLQMLEKCDVGLFLMLGFAEPFLYFILETYTYKLFATPTIAEAFLSTNPLIAPVFAFFLLGEKASRRTWIGILVSTVGMLMLVLNLHAGDDFVIGNLWAVPLALVTVCMAAIYSILLKKIPTRYSPLSIVFWGQLAGLMMFVLLYLVRYGVEPLPHWGEIAMLRGVSEEQVSVAWRGIAYLGVMSSVAAFVLFCYSVREIGVVTANLFNNIRPVFTALLMLILMGEQLPLIKWLGIFIIVAGLYICTRSKTDRKNSTLVAKNGEVTYP